MSSNRLLREVVWFSAQGQGAEHLALWQVPDGYSVRSDWIGVENGQPARAVYRLELDPAWAVRKLRVAWSMSAATERLRLMRDPDGAWWVNGQRGPDLGGLVDVDIAWSAFTNTLPIRRLGLVIREHRELSVVYVAPPALKVVTDEQRYTRLGPEHWRYESLDSDFTAEITVDEDGLVIDYPPIFRRAAQWREGRR